MADPKDQLRSCLDTVKYVGRFTSYETSHVNADPGIFINDVGNISLPLVSEKAELILRHADQAPFGRGSNTVIDKSFRNTKQLDADSFQLRNPAWPNFLLGILTRLGVRLGYQDSPVGIRADLHKLLLYEKGAMFKPHRESVIPFASSVVDDSIGLTVATALRKQMACLPPWSFACHPNMKAVTSYSRIMMRKRSWKRPWRLNLAKLMLHGRTSTPSIYRNRQPRSQVLRRPS